MDPVTIPNFFVVGAPKCGTTSMDTYLKQHPEIFVPDEKEFQYFGKDIKRGPEIYCSTEKYLAAFQSATDEKSIGETSVLYLYSRLAATEIKQFNPDARIIIMLREPVDMLISYHTHLYYSHIEDVAEFQAALEKGETRRFAIPGGEHELDPEVIANTLDLRVYRDVVKYTNQVKRYFDVFGRDKVHVILFDDFKKDAAGVYREALEFLGVDPDFQPDFRVLNPSRAFRRGGAHGKVWRPPIWLRSIARKLLTREQRERLVELIFDKLARRFAKEQPREAIDPDLKAALREEFVQEVDDLSALLGRDLSRWRNL